MSARWRLDVVGPVRLHRCDGGDTPVVLSVKRSKALLVLLALQGPQSRGQVAGLLWPELPEGAARRNLRRELVRLREQGAEGVVVAEGDRLALAADVACLPAGDTAAAVAESTPPQLASDLVLGDAEAFDAWLARQREQALLGWQQALAAQAQAFESEQRHAEALSRWQALLAADPLQEPLHQAVIRACLALGRRDAALKQYERCRELLAAELGLEPMAATTALIEELREGRAVPAATASAPRAPEASGAGMPTRVELPDQLPFTGREAEVAQLEAWWQRGPGVVWISGEGGIGKTRLATGLAAAHGSCALVGCRATDRATPYASLARALRVFGGERAQALPVAPWARDELAPVLEPGSTASRATSDRPRLHRALRLAWHGLLGTGLAEGEAGAEPGLRGDPDAEADFDAVVVDDFHLADAASQEVMVELAAAGPGTRLMLLVRGDELDAAGQAARTHLIEAVPTMPVLELAPLPEEAVLALVRQISGAQDGTRFARRLERATAGNPFFLAQSLRNLVELGQLGVDAQGRWTTPFDAVTADYTELPVPTSVEAAVQARVARLPEATRRLIEAASLAAEPFEPGLLAGACALSELAGLQALEAALDARLLRDAEPSGYAFAHDLIRQGVQHAMPAHRQRLLHRRLALAAEAAGAEPALVAAHLEAAGDSTRAVASRMAAADRARRLHALPEAQAHWEQALANGPTPGQRIRILARLGLLWRQLGQGGKVAAAIAELDALRTVVGDEALALEATVHAAYLCCQVNRADEVVERLSEVLAAGIADPRLRLRAIEAQGMGLLIRLRFDEAEQLLAAGLADREADAAERVQLLHVLTAMHVHRGQKAAALEVCECQLTLVQALGDRQREAQTCTRIGILAEFLGQRPRAIKMIEHAVALAAELGLIEVQREALRALADIELYAGRPRRAIELAQRARALAAQFALPQLAALLDGIEHRGHAQCGELGVALDRSDEAIARVAGLTEVNALRQAIGNSMDLRVQIGLHDEARALLDRVPLPPDGAEPGIFDVRLMYCHATLALDRGDWRIAETVLARVPSAHVADDREARAHLGLRQAELALLRGHGAQAQQLLGGLPQPLPMVEHDAAALLLRCRAQRAGGEADPTLGEEIDALLQGGHCPALDALALHRERAAQPGRGSDAAAAQALFERLRVSLASRPSAQAAFTARWRDA